MQSNPARPFSPHIIKTSATWFPHAFDPNSGNVLIVAHDEESYKKASFLDDRALSPNTPRQILHWDFLHNVMADVKLGHSNYIFHIGHVGSTLISRLLGEMPEVLALREPMVLRTLHDLSIVSDQPESPLSPQQIDDCFRIFGELLSRSFHSEQSVLIKATSYTSEIAPRLMDHKSHALLMYTSPEHFIANIFAGDQSRRELQLLAGGRLKRLSRYLGEAPWALWQLSEGKRIALSWVCEMLALDRASTQAGSRALYCDFDGFLARPVEEFVRISAFFGYSITETSAENVLKGPLMSRYSKGLDHEYSPELRRQILMQSRDQNRDEIRDAMAWIEEAARRYPQVGDCIQNMERRAS